MTAGQGGCRDSLPAALGLTRKHKAGQSRIIGTQTHEVPIPGQNPHACSLTPSQEPPPPTPVRTSAQPKYLLLPDSPSREAEGLPPLQRRERGPRLSQNHTAGQGQAPDKKLLLPAYPQPPSRQGPSRGSCDNSDHLLNHAVCQVRILCSSLLGRFLYQR